MLLLDTNDTIYYNKLLQYLINRHNNKEETYKTYNINKNDLDNYKNYLDCNECPFPIYNLSIPDEYDANIKFGRYLNNPCIKTATQLFKKLKLPIPLLELLNKEKNNLTIIEKDTKDTSIKNNIDDSVNIKKNKKTYNTLLRLDFLHDIHNIHISSNYKYDLASLILDDLDVDLKYKQLFIDSFTNNSKNSTKIFSDYFIQNENLDDSLKTTKYILKNNRINLECDREIYTIWLSWIKNKTLKIVLDGLFIQYEASHYIQNSNESQFCASMIQTAFILLLFHNAHKIYHIHNKRNIELKEIILLDGVFNKIEKFFTIKYYKKYLDSLKKSSKTYKVQLETIGTEIQPIYYKKYYNDYTYIETTIDNDVQIHIDENIILTTHHNSLKIKKIKDKLNSLSHINSINMYYDKEELLDLIDELYEIVLKDENTKLKTLLDILIDFNFLKDSYRVDVAIQTDSVFITHDRLAFIYYNLIVKWEKKDNKSLFIRAPLIINNIDPSIQVIIGNNNNIHNNIENNVQENNDNLHNLITMYSKK